MQQQNNRDLKAVIVGSILILLVGGYFFWRFFSASPETDTAADTVLPKAGSEAAPSITPEILQKKLINREALRIIDVRSGEAYQAEHIPHSLSLPGSLLSEFSPEKDESIIVISSESDPTASEIAQNILAQKSFPYAILKGGFEAWKAQGYQTLSAGDPNSFIDQSKVTYIAALELKQALSDVSSKLFLLDVQSPENFAKNHLKGAVNIPLSQLEKRAEEIPSARPIIVYGENELASFRAGVRLSDLNIFTAKTLKGNDILSPQSGLPLEKQ